MTTLSGSHVIAGAAVAVSSLGSALAIDMMAGGGGAPPFNWPRGFVPYSGMPAAFGSPPNKPAAAS